MENGLNTKYRNGHLQQLVAQLRLQTPRLQGPEAEALDRLANIADREDLDPTLGDVFEAEVLLVKTMPDERLEPFAKSLSYRYKAAHGSDMPTPKDPHIPNELRQHLIEGLSEMFREIESRRTKEEGLSKHILFMSLVGVLIILVVVLIGTWIDRKPGQYFIPSYIFIIVAGSLGSVVGYIRDLLTPRGDADLTLLTFEIEAAQKYWPYRILSGSVYALVLTLIVAILPATNDLVSSSLFPSFKGYFEAHPNSQGLMIVFLNRLPSQEYLKLLVWCFAAGFVQPFVPGIFDRMIARSEAANKSTANANQPVASTSPQPS